jgi:hypothetical protein
MAIGIDWTYLVVEMSLLAGIIFGAVYVDRWHYIRALNKESRESQAMVRRLITRDLERKLEVVQNIVEQKRTKPLFTNIWDSVLFTGKQGSLTFELFDMLHSTYSLMRYYNSEAEKRHDSLLEAHIEEILSDVAERIKESLEALKAQGEQNANR